MIAYHGSNRDFRTLRISDKLVNSDSTRHNEGLGIYFSTDINVAKSYGKYMYTIEINDKYLIDFRKKGNCRKYINNIRLYIKEKSGVNIARYINLESIAEYAYLGNIAIWGITKEIELMLDSTERWYDLAPSKIEKVYSMLRGFSKRNLKAYMFNYNIKNIGVIKSAKEDVVRIVKKEVCH